MTDSNVLKHATVLLNEAVDGLVLGPDAFVVDCTFGRGGHSRRILEVLGPGGRLLALDKDADAIAWARSSGLLDDPRFEIEHASFAELGSVVGERARVGGVSGILMDLGVSSPQLDDAGRGFSFMRDGPLDMRMNTAQGKTAAQWLAHVSEDELARVLRDYGEERFSGRIARAIVAACSRGALETTGQLARLIEETLPFREKGKHPATRSFQAIRIAVNQELEDLESGLKQAMDVLQPGGRLAVISFHSLEDRRVKRFMRDHEYAAGPDERSVITGVREPGLLKRVGKAIMPGAVEIRENPRARSAVLRVAERRTI